MTRTNSTTSAATAGPAYRVEERMRGTRTGQPRVLRHWSQANGADLTRADAIRLLADQRYAEPILYGHRGRRFLTLVQIGA